MQNLWFQLTTAFRSLKIFVISLFSRGAKPPRDAPWFDLNSLRNHFGYLDDIQTQQGESEPKDSPFLFSESRIFRASSLTLDLKIRYGSEFHISKIAIFVFLSTNRYLADIWLSILISQVFIQFNFSLFNPIYKIPKFHISW